VLTAKLSFNSVLPQLAVTYKIEAECCYQTFVQVDSEVLRNRQMRQHAKLDSTFIKLLNQMEKTNLINLDDFGLQPLNMEARLALLQILEDRYRKKSMIIASQLSVKLWYEYLQDSTLADAILDRITAHAHRIELQGKSLRHKK